jgi:hypothetical protein
MLQWHTTSRLVACAFDPFIYIERLSYTLKECSWARLAVLIQRFVGNSAQDALHAMTQELVPAGAALLLVLSAWLQHGGVASTAYMHAAQS